MAKDSRLLLCVGIMRQSGCGKTKQIFSRSVDNHSSTEKKGMKKQNAVSGCSNMLHAIMPEDVLQAALLAFILTMLFLQAGPFKP